MSLQRGSNVRGWEGVTRNLAVNSEERAAWTFSTISLLLALTATGIAAFVLAQVDIPVVAKAIMAVGVLLFTTVLISSVYSRLINRTVDEDISAAARNGAEPEPRPVLAPIPAPAANIPLMPEVATPPPPAPEPVQPVDIVAIPDPVEAEVVAEAPAADTAEESPGTRPEALDGPRGGVADDLTLIKGVGPKMAKLCNSLGFYHFDQIASWTADEVAWVDDNLEGFKGRVSRDEWVDQAKILAAGGETEFSSRQS